MRFLVEEEEVYVLNEVQKKVICNDISMDVIDADLKRRVKYIIEHKYEQCLKRLKDEWMPNLKASGVTSIPLDDDEFAQLVFSQTEYKDRKDRDLEEI